MRDPANSTQPRSSDLPGLDRLVTKAIEAGLSPPSIDARTTNWVVISGTYSAGKTTLVADLAEHFHVPGLAEPARLYFEGTPQARGSAGGDLIGPIHERRLALENSLSLGRGCILDTAVPDTLAYALLYDTGISTIVKACRLFRYLGPIIFAEPLANIADGIRSADENERSAVGYLRRRVYESMGYDVIRIPPLPRVARCQRVIEAVQKHFQGGSDGVERRVDTIKHGKELTRDWRDLR